MDDSQIFLKEDDVLSAPATALMYQCTFKVSELMTIMQSKLVEEKLFSDGMDCEVLSAGKPWTKGKLRMRLEFSPNEEPAEIKEQKALPAALEESDTAQAYNQNSSEQTDTDEQLNSHPRSLGMWS
jgi:hypothetical protein